MRPELQKIYPLTDISISGMSHGEQVECLANSGARFIQLREKALAPRDFYEQARAALKLARLRGVTLIVNDRVDIAMALNADGVHLGQDDLPVHSARRLLGPQAIIGISTHSLEQAEQAIKLPIDYLAIGPLFNTSTKSDASPTVGLEGLKAVKAIAGALPVVGIGGITADRIPSVLAAGADSVALISALWAGPNELSTRISPFLQQP